MQGELGIDNNGNLYWNQKRVITEQKISLNLWVNIFIIITGIATVVMALIDVLDYFEISKLVCK